MHHLVDITKQQHAVLTTAFSWTVVCRYHGKTNVKQDIPATSIELSEVNQAIHAVLSMRYNYCTGVCAPPILQYVSPVHHLLIAHARKNKTRHWVGVASLESGSKVIRCVQASQERGLHTTS